ncbi:Glutathione peroxidase [Parvularcula bermudensis HTCC2503]|uniref:Glutathione peroxidase n=1 Tax=Parvularcula bermudensis (strain ATCC BAA-594 / HTCC2503 / KCTC 12087) TaxID=314260 RepID=E0TBC0_PARBH|nr:glutathione peroxidase [Parvularcula bermudensis]ADM08324.1 Glutathione peroxidase [Parvularcula bermudensis HTCC2503]
MTDRPFDSIPLRTIAGDPLSLADFAGKVILIVNVASKCGLTPQYAALQALYEAKKDQGLVILGVPANDFAGQEPGTDEEIQTFCATTYDVDFPLLSKAVVTGPSKHPLYAALTDAQPVKTGDADGFRAKLRSFGSEPTEDPEVLWNFEKFLIGKEGKVIGRFVPTTAPDDPALISAIDAALAA